MDTKTVMLKHRGRLSPEEIKRRKEALREYALAHPDLTREEIMRNRDLQSFLYVYQGKVRKALYDVITIGLSPKEVPAEDFRSFVSYIVSSIYYYMKKNNIPMPSLEDMKQDGMVGILRARQRYKEGSFEQTVSYFDKCIGGSVYEGLEKSCSPINVPRNELSGLIRLCRFDFSAAEGKTRGLLSSTGVRYKNETLDKLIKILQRKNLGPHFLKNIQDSSKIEKEDMSAVRNDLDVFMGNLNERDKRIFISRLEELTLEAIAIREGLCRERVRQIEEKSFNYLVRHITHLLALEDCHAIRLYREYFEK